MKRPDGVVLISIYHWVVAVLGLVSLCFMAMMPLFVAVVMAGSRETATGALVVFIFMIVAAFFLLLLTVAYAVVGWGLWRLKPWGRLGAIILAVLSMITCVPLGTVLGAVIVWYLFQPAAKAAFGETDEKVL